jgi:hypothetical protein
MLIKLNIIEAQKKISEQSFPVFFPDMDFQIWAIYLQHAVNEKIIKPSLILENQQQYQHWYLLINLKNCWVLM